MKYLEEKTLSWANAALNEFYVGDRIINGRLECFSCKKAGKDKKLAKSLELQYINNNNEINNGSIGNLSDSNTRKVLINLISTMNASFPDYDFSNLKPEQFQKEIDMRRVVNGINTQLAEIVEMDNIGFLEKLWESIITSIQPTECDIYSYIPDMDGCSDPFSEDTLWSFNYFFYNRELKKILYFTCMSKSAFHENHNDDGEDDDDENMNIQETDEEEDDDVAMEGDWEDGA